MIRPVTAADAAAICGIYNYYVDNSAISFEEEPLSVGDMEKRIRDISAAYPYLVREDNGEILGYAYVNKWKERASYRFSVEASVYLKNGLGGKGVGSDLFRRLLEEVRKTDIHAVVAGITQPNPASVGMCEKLGFKKVGIFNEIGYKQGAWHDVGYWELIL
jgi:phosphinothricin acetyltransferase